MDKVQLEYAVKWLEQQQKTLQAVSEDQLVKTDYTRGFNKGIQFTNKYYQDSIKELRQLLSGYLVNDVDLSGSDYYQESL